MKPKMQKQAQPEASCITVKLVNVLQADPALRQLFNTPFRPLMAMKLSKLAKEINRTLADFTVEQKAAFEEFGVLNAETNQWEFGDKQEAFNERMDTIVEQEVSIFAAPVLVSELGGATFSAEFMSQLDWLIQE